jgi:pyruvate-formate lyase-activating enzyme
LNGAAAAQSPSRAIESIGQAGDASPLHLDLTAVDDVGLVDLDKAVRALEMVKGREALYLRVLRLTASAPAYVPPGRFVRQCLAELRGLIGAVAEIESFFGWAIARGPRARLLPTLAAEHFAQRGDREKARRFAEHALSVNQNDLHAQRLLAAALDEHEPDLTGRFCSNPFDKLETLPHGDVYFCCSAWLSTPIGNLERQSVDEIWNSPAAQDIRRSILDGSYRYCSRMHCPKIAARTLPLGSTVANPYHQAVIRGRRTRLDQGPQRVVLSHDRSCNLSCPSCRTRVISARKDEQERMNGFAERVLFPLLADARRVQVTGSGDPFASAHFRFVLKRLAQWRRPDLKVDLQTNGLLLHSSWEELGLEGLVDRVYVSVDAARPETYRIVRRGGEFARLLDNLAFLAVLRAEGRVRSVRLEFVTQALNFREMPEAVDLARRFGFDGVKFQMIRSWNTYSAAEFARHNIGSPDHPEFAAFQAVLRDPRLHGGDAELWGFHGPAAAPAAGSDNGARPSVSAAHEVRPGR